jgi:putative Mg2+ transporter-C (MgtC) family protein
MAPFPDSDLLRALANEIPGAAEAVRLSARLLVAALAGGLLGYERGRSGKSAGLRTHMLVGLASATFVVAMVGASASVSDIAHVTQGVAAGIGFIGGGAILKAAELERVSGITTASSIWMTSALGVAAGLGRLWIAAFAAIVAWVVLGVLLKLEPHAPAPGPAKTN